MSQRDYVRDVLTGAAKGLVRRYRGGGDAIGALIGKSAGVLNNEINPDQPHAKLGLIDAVRLELFANDDAILRAHAHLLGRVCYVLPAPDSLIGDASLLEAFSRWQAANGATCDAIRQIVDPDSPAGAGVTLSELELLADAGERQAEQFLALLARFREIAEPDPTTNED
jgi:hypothetical protein